MENWIYLLIAIGLIVVLIAIFFISYYFNKKTPVPKGCEHLLVEEENCKTCKIADCELRKEKVSSEINQNTKNSLKEDR